ncbi:MAG: SBBP repeat-containing protein [Syntrophobacteraceae bacterium]
MSLVVAVTMMPSFSVGANTPFTNQKICPQPRSNPLQPIAAKKKAVIAKAYGRLPLYFITNKGQTDPKVAFYQTGAGHTTFFTRQAIVLSLEKQETRADPMSNLAARRKSPVGKSLAGRAPRVRTSSLKIGMLGANKDIRILPEEPSPGKVNYFIGNDPHKWRTNIATYGAILYKNAYPGIDVKFYGNNRRLEYDIIVKPGADPSLVKFGYSGAKALQVTKNGNLQVALADGGLIQQKPVVYQQIGGKRVIRRGTFVVRKEVGASHVAKASAGTPASLPTFTCSFELGPYDKNVPLIIDPTLVYSTYLGGSGTSGDSAYSIAVDASGDAYVAGATSSPDFPVVSGAFQSTLYSSYSNAFITEITPDGSSLVYSTYLGGSGTNGDAAYGIAIDPSGNAYVAGATSSADFPVTPGAFQTKLYSSSSNGFVTEIAPGGYNLVYSTYLGGSGANGDSAQGITIDGYGNTYVTGSTSSTDFPVTSGAFQPSLTSSYSNAFVTEIAPGGYNLVYSTYLGGSGGVSNGDSAYAIAIAPSGNVYVAGVSYSSDFPVTSGAFQTSLKSSFGNAFVTGISPGGSALVYSTYLGGSGGVSNGDSAYGIAVDAAGNVYVTGAASSADFPVTAGAFQTSLKSSIGDAFVTEIAPDGSTLVYSTYLGGSGTASNGDFTYGIAIDAAGNAYVAGATFSADFPVTSGAFQPSLKSSYSNGFVTEIAAGGSSLVYSTYLGGSGTNGDFAEGVSLDPSGNIYVTGTTSSTDFPVTSNAFQTSLKSSSNNAFVTRIANLWQGATPVGNSWYYLQWFGYFYAGSFGGSSGWIYHDTLGWLYAQGSSTSSIWVYDPKWNGKGGWWWTNATVYPWIYSTTEGEWFFYDTKSTPGARWFGTSSGQWATH